MPHHRYPPATSTAWPAAPSLPGVQVGPKIGRGTGSTVYRASREGVDHALKILDAPPVEPAPILIGYRREAALLAEIAHPRLPVVHEVGMVDGRPYLVMDLFEGRPLTELIRDGRLDPREAIRVSLDVAGPLARMHETGIIHRDLKPDNIVIMADGAARLIDFGLAVHVESALPELAPGSLAVGTLAYSAPEQAGTLRRPVDHHSDLYSLGVLLFECLTGSLPFTTDDVGELLRSHASKVAPDPRSLVAVGPGVATVVNLSPLFQPDHPSSLKAGGQSQPVAKGSVSARRRHSPGGVDERTTPGRHRARWAGSVPAGPGRPARLGRHSVHRGGVCHAVEPDALGSGRSETRHISAHTALQLAY